MSPDNTKQKRRRLQGACDICRQKKVRCDSATMPNNRCTNCLAFNAECTHHHSTQKTIYKFKSLNGNRPKKGGSLDQRRGEMKPIIEAILSPTYQAPSNPAIIRNTLVSLASYASLLEERLSKDGNPSDDTPSPSSTQDNDTPVLCGIAHYWDSANIQSEVDPEVEHMSDLAEGMRGVSIYEGRSRTRFFGPSSNSSLVKAALDIGADCPINTAATPDNFGLLKFKRPFFWRVQKWDSPPPRAEPVFRFPEPDLLDHLVQVYFQTIDNLVPVFHRPSFERAVKAGLHHTDTCFAKCLLAMCAIAARHSRDRRVIENPGDPEMKAGHQWFSQIEVFKQSFEKPPTLYELQMYWLATLYLHGTSTPEKCWYLVGLAIRGAQDAGFHRQDRALSKPTVQTESRKRIWWVLVMADLVSSISVGRPRCIRAEDCDIDLPLEVDDEYWEHPNPALAFKQPEGKPSRVTSLIKSIELFEILISAQDAFFSVNTPEGDSDWKQETLASIDSTLNSWVDSIPPFLRWDASSFDLFFDQSAYLFANYYWVQILVHSPFIVHKNKMFLSSYAICTNASRACSRILEIHSRRGGLVAIPQTQGALFKAGLIVMLSIWRAKQTGVPLNEEKEMETIYRCVRVLQKLERRWHAAGRFIDVLRALAAASNLPFPDALPITATDDISLSPTQPPPPPLMTPPLQVDQSFKDLDDSLMFDFPVHSNQLSRPIFQTYYQGPRTDSTVQVGARLDDFETMFAMSGGDVAHTTNVGIPEDAASSTAVGPSSYDPQVTHQSSVTEGAPLYDMSGWGGAVPTDFDWNSWGTYVSNMQAMGFQ
ncbi:fungal-specific transcription factor domain-containing protein [Coprinopsis sp. MPI-PUGE-AT-0042]|nr:fungal-specific transcription factor domain-containing protein [Coprinopsis sp. MPI-PUGE-AT-0042]